MFHVHICGTTVELNLISNPFNTFWRRANKDLQDHTITIQAEASRCDVNAGSRLARSRQSQCASKVEWLARVTLSWRQLALAYPLIGNACRAVARRDVHFQGWSGPRGRQVPTSAHDPKR